MSFKNFGKLLICGALASVFIACGGGSDYKEFVADMDIEKRALERVKEMYPNSKIYDPVSFVGVAKQFGYILKPNHNYRKSIIGNKADYKDSKMIEMFSVDEAFVTFVVEKEKGKFYGVQIWCPIKDDKPCASADKINLQNKFGGYENTNIEYELDLYTDDERKANDEKIKKDKEMQEQAEKMKKQLGL